MEWAPRSGPDRFAPDGRLVDIHEYATHQEALEAVGLQE